MRLSATACMKFNRKKSKMDMSKGNPPYYSKTSGQGMGGRIPTRFSTRPILILLASGRALFLAELLQPSRHGLTGLLRNFDEGRRAFHVVVGIYECDGSARFPRASSATDSVHVI